MKLNRTCQKIQNWVLFHPGEDIPAFVSKHIKICTCCSQFAKEERWINSLLQKSKELVPPIPLEHSLKVKQAIWETSQILTKKKQKVNLLFPRVAGAMTVLSILLIFFFAPLYQGESYFGFQVNQQLGGFINNQETVSIAFRDNVAVSEGLKFASEYVQTPEEKSFYYSTNSLSKEKYLLIKFLSKKTKATISQIHDWLSEGGYAYLLRHLHLPYQKTVEEIQAYIDMFRISPSIPIFSLDGSITRIDYTNDSIWIDSYNQEIRVDSTVMQTIYIGLYATFSLQEKENSTLCTKLEASLFPTTIVTGKIDQKTDQEIYLQGNPSPIKITSKTIFNDLQEPTTDQSTEDMQVRIRVLIYNDTMTAITVTPLIVGTKRTMTGVLDQVFKYGFTLHNLGQSFCFESLPKTVLTNLPEGTIMTVTGQDYGTYFLVSDFTIIHNPLPIKPGPTYYLASADPLPESSSKAARTMKPPENSSFDYVVGADTKNTYLASGKTISISLGKFPIGSKIKISSTKSSSESFSFVEIGTSSVYQGNVVFQRKLNNGAYLYESEQKNKTILMLPKIGTTLPDKGILQGIMIQYDSLSIMIDYRLFQMKLQSTTKGLITKVMNDTNMFILDNGILLQIDSWTQIIGGTLGIGKTIQLIGSNLSGIFHAYIVTLQREDVIFKGVIVEIDRQKQIIHLDSGQIITYNKETNMQLLKAQLEKGDMIYVKAYLDEKIWIALDIWMPKESSQDLGDTL